MKTDTKVISSFDRGQSLGPFLVSRNSLTSVSESCDIDIKTESTGKGKMAKYNYALRFDSKAQMELIQKAAKTRRWSLNTFMIATAEEKANEILGGGTTREATQTEVAAEG